MRSTPALTAAINICQVSNLILSALTNISATSLIGYRAWYAGSCAIRGSILTMYTTYFRRHRISVRGISGRHNTSTKAGRVLTILVESGFLYCVSGVSPSTLFYFCVLISHFQVSVLISTMIRLPHGMLGDIYIPIQVQIAVCFFDAGFLLLLIFICRAFIPLLSLCS